MNFMSVKLNPSENCQKLQFTQHSPLAPFSQESFQTHSKIHSTKLKPLYLERLNFRPHPFSARPGHSCQVPYMPLSKPFQYRQNNSNFRREATKSAIQQRSAGVHQPVYIIEKYFPSRPALSTGKDGSQQRGEPVAREQNIHRNLLTLQYYQRMLAGIGSPPVSKIYKSFTRSPRGQTSLQSTRFVTPSGGACNSHTSSVGTFPVQPCIGACVCRRGDLR